jgi:hypothetical protein
VRRRLEMVKQALLPFDDNNKNINPGLMYMFQNIVAFRKGYLYLENLIRNIWHLPLYAEDPCITGKYYHRPLDTESRCWDKKYSSCRLSVTTNCR